MPSAIIQCQDYKRKLKHSPTGSQGRADFRMPRGAAGLLRVASQPLGGGGWGLADSPSQTARQTADAGAADGGASGVYGPGDLLESLQTLRKVICVGTDPPYV